MDSLISLRRAFSTSPLLFALLLLLVQVALGTPAPPPAVLAFGDSIVDTGNNNHLFTLVKANFPPYGKEFIGRKATGRFCDGKITSDFIASGLKVKELLPAYSDPNITDKDLLTGVSFASAGAGYDIVSSKSALVTSMAEQLELFKEYKERLKAIAGEEKAARIISQSIYIVCAGSNDVVSYFLLPVRKIQYNIPSYAKFLMNISTSFIQELVGLGAKTIATFGMPPIGCVPIERTLAGGLSRGCATDHNGLAQSFNSKLKKEVLRLNATSHGLNLFYVDVYSTLLHMIQHPQHYGFQESTKGCCGTGLMEYSFLCNNITTTTCSDASKYVFWDSYHPTQRAYEIIVNTSLHKYLHFLP